MVWLDLSSISDSRDAEAEIGVDVRKFLTAPNIAALALQDSDEKLADNKGPEPEDSKTQTGEFAALYGKYLEQVSARVNRAWMRPRSELTTHRFECDVTIRQDRQGNVLSIEMTRCDADARWRQTLTSAIFGASPLSAPSEPWLFTDLINLRFSAADYLSAVGSESDYEPAPLRLASAPGPTHSQLEPASPAAPFAPPADGDVDLTIVGSEIRWEQSAPPVTPNP